MKNKKITIKNSRKKLNKNKISHQINHTNPQKLLNLIKNNKKKLQTKTPQILYLKKEGRIFKNKKFLFKIKKIKKNN